MNALMRTLNRWLAPDPIPSTPPVDVEAVWPLDRILVVLARRSGGETARLMCDGIGFRQLTFKSDAALRVGETVQLHVLLSQACALNVSATVVVARSEGRTTKGVARFEPDAMQADLLNAFTKKLTSRAA